MSHAIIAGAGIGGLAAARALLRAAWTVTLLERAAAARELAFASLLAPNAVRALRLLGVADEVLAQDTLIRRGEIRGHGGRLLRRLDAAPVSARLGEPTVVRASRVNLSTSLKISMCPRL